MTTIRSGVPGHDDGTAFVRLRRGKLADGPSGQREWDNTTEGPYEIVCPGCGDDPSRDGSEISGELRRIRGPVWHEGGSQGRAYGSHRHADALTATGLPWRVTGQPDSQFICAREQAITPSHGEGQWKNARRPAVMRADWRLVMRPMVTTESGDPRAWSSWLDVTFCD